MRPLGLSDETATGEFEVSGGLPVDDLMYVSDPMPMEGRCSRLPACFDSAESQ